MGLTEVFSGLGSNGRDPHGGSAVDVASSLPATPSPPPTTSLEARVAALESRILCAPDAPRELGPGTMLNLDEVARRMGEPLGAASFSGVSVLPDPGPKQRYHDRSTVIVCPTRGQIDSRVIECWNGLIHAMNQRRVGPIFARGYEVGSAYDALISGVIEHPQLKSWKYVLTIEDDNLPPPDGHMKLLEAMEEHPEYDGIAGLYHTKDALQTPMAYGDPAEYARTGKTLHFPVDRSILDPRGGPVEVLGIPMGFTLWRMDLFRKVPPSWFVTLSDKILVDGTLVKFDEISNEQAADAKRCMTQDLAFCEISVKKFGCRFAVHPGVRVGHLDVAEGTVY